MQNTKINNQSMVEPIESFPSFVTQYSLANATSRGIVIEITQSVSRSAFSDGLVRVFLTARLLRALGASCVKNDVVVEKEHCLAHAASQAWQRANELGREATTFYCSSVADTDGIPGVQLRLERMRSRACSVFTIGFPEDFLSLG